MDDRPLKLIERTPVEEEHKQRLRDICQWADGAAKAHGKELQSEFGKEHVGLILGCNQFVRIYRAGAHAGKIELWLEAPGQEALAGAGFTAEPAVGGVVFQMFGWRTYNPVEAASAPLKAAVEAGAARAAVTKQTM